jgi:hypothetical protein
MAYNLEYLTFNNIPHIKYTRGLHFHIGGIFYDLTKAFGCVNHDILIAKLEHYGIQEITLNWFKSYLINRK